MAYELSKKYKQRFGEKNLNYPKLNKFPLKSNLNVKRDKLLNEMKKSDYTYSL